MSNRLRESFPYRALDDLIWFAGIYSVSQVAEVVGDQIHNPNITDVPPGGAALLGLVLASISTVIGDRLMHPRNPGE